MQSPAMSSLSGFSYKKMENIFLFQFYFVPLHRYMHFCLKKRNIEHDIKTGDSTAVLKVLFIGTDKGKRDGVMNQRHGC